MNRREKSDNINGWLGYFSAYGARPGLDPKLNPVDTAALPHPTVMCGWPPAGKGLIAFWRV
jgi:hypothetical protein